MVSPTARPPVGGLGSALFAGWLGFAGFQHKHTWAQGPTAQGPKGHGPMGQGPWAKVPTGHGPYGPWARAHGAEKSTKS